MITATGNTDWVLCKVQEAGERSSHFGEKGSFMVVRLDL